MLQNQDIVCFAPADWWGMNPSCTTHIMKRLAEKNKIVYINPISSDLIGVRETKGLGARIIRKLRSLLRCIAKVNQNLYVVSPLFFPVQGNQILDRINNTLFKMQLKALLFFLRIKNPLLWIENIRAADFIESFNWYLVIYHVSDRFEKCPYTHNKQKLREREILVSDQSDLIICVSQELYEAKKDLNENVYYLPHGVDYEHIREVVENGEENKFFHHNFSHPIAGYFGTLTAQNDIELLQYCAINMQDVTFVFAGQITAGDYSELAQMPNVIFLGHVPYEEITSLCAVFDVCLLPWKINKWIASCNPLKLQEYLASGKPIVSVPIDEIVNNYSDVVKVAWNKEDFCLGIRNELENDTPRRKQKRIAIAKAHSWDRHNMLLSQMITESLDRKYGS